ncbi:MAG: site-specific integrase [Beijerinckiaceae bacterium]|nr:site-specific integrase [Beijerinckiaceae bacterium]
MAAWFIQKQKDDAPLGIDEVAPAERLEELTYATDPNDTNFPSFIRSTTRKFLEQQHIALDANSDAFRRLSRLIHEAYIEREKRLIRRYMGEGTIHLNPRFANLDATSDLHPGAKITLRLLIERYENDRSKANNAPKTAKTHTARFRLFEDLFGPEKAIAKIGREDARLLYETVSRLPANAKKRFPGKGIKDLLRLPDEKLGKPMSPTTANSYLMGFTALMEFAVNEHLIDKNPAKGLKIASDGEKAQDKREGFDLDDLRKIFSAPLYLGCQNDGRGYSEIGNARPRRGRFWVPLIALFSGLRANEICQLDEDDVAIIADCDVLRIRASTERKKTLKTKAAARIMPIHPELKRLGFLTYVHSIRQNGPPGGRLFPELTVASTGYASDNFSKWFANFMDHIGIVDPKKNFHSFRHTFRDAFRLVPDVPPERVRMLGGWTLAGSDARYGGSAIVTARMLSEEIGKIGYPGLNLDGLLA